MALKAFQCMPVRSTSKMAFMAARSGTRGLWHPSGCLGLGGSRGSICSHNSSGIRQPSSFFTNPIACSCSHPQNGRHCRRPTGMSS